jgi:hypothetical protein
MILLVHKACHCFGSEPNNTRMLLVCSIHIAEMAARSLFRQIYYFFSAVFLTLSRKNILLSLPNDSLTEIGEISLNSQVIYKFVYKSSRLEISLFNAQVMTDSKFFYSPSNKLVKPVPGCFSLHSSTNVQSHTPPLCSLNMEHAAISGMCLEPTSNIPVLLALN